MKSEQFRLEGHHLFVGAKDDEVTVFGGLCLNELFFEGRLAVAFPHDDCFVSKWENVVVLELFVWGAVGFCR